MSFPVLLQFLAVLGVVLMVVGTATIVSDHMRGDDGPHVSDYRDFPRPFVPQANGPVAVDDAVLNHPAAVNAPQLPAVDGGDVIKNDVIGDDVMQKEEVHMPAVDVVPVSEEGKMEEVVREGGGEEKEGGGGEEGVGLKQEHDSIMKDMEELKDRIKAVEVENKELKVDTLQTKNSSHLPCSKEDVYIQCCLILTPSKRGVGTTNFQQLSVNNAPCYIMHID